MKRDRLKIFIYGAGRVGGTLRYALHRRAVVHILKRKGSKIRGCSFEQFVKRPENYDLIIISVPDSQISSVAESIYIALHKNVSKKVIVCHTSGTLSYENLKRLRERGFIVCALHPYFSFYKTRKDVDIEKICFTLSCNQCDVRLIKGVLKKAGIRPVYIDDREKIPYHISAVFVSNFTALLLRIAYELLRKTDFPQRDAENFIFSLLNSTLFNLKKFGIENTITGPAVRRDKGILKMHSDYLKNSYPEVYKLYTLATGLIQQLYGSHNTFLTKR